MTIIKKTSVVEWATQEVGVACDMVSQTTVENFDFQTGESLGEYKFEPVVVTQLQRDGHNERPQTSWLHRNFK